MDARYLAKQIPLLGRHGRNLHPLPDPIHSGTQHQGFQAHRHQLGKSSPMFSLLETFTDMWQEWAIVFIAAFIFFAGCEGYKLVKRVYFRRKAKKTDGPKMLSAEDRVFSRYLSTDSRWDSEGEKNEKMRSPV
jgi:hypothetical protein